MTGAVTSSPAWRIEFDRAAQIKAGLIGIAFIGVFYNTLMDLQSIWQLDPDWSHGWIVPLFAAYLVHLRWDEIRRCEIRGTGVGLALVLLSLAMYVYFLFGAQFGYIKPLTMLLCLLGVIIFLCGRPVLRYAFLPWAYLFFAVPLPKGLYFALTDPLRRLAAWVATGVLSLIPNLDIQPSGSVIHYQYLGNVGSLGVADACSGMRSTITLCALGVAIAFVQPRPWWQRLIMLASCVPIAVFSNFIRVSVTCLLYIFVGETYATGTYHMALGMVTLLLAFGIFLGLGWILSNLTVEEEDGADLRTESRP
ncbi:MAG: exosortase/archaeosortase family protein [Phycisphaerae bacterium]